MSVERLALDFLYDHVDADEIVMDSETGFPLRAVYSGVDCTGNHRKQPAVFWFDGGGDIR